MRVESLVIDVFRGLAEKNGAGIIHSWRLDKDVRPLKFNEWIAGDAFSKAHHFGHLCSISGFLPQKGEELNKSSWKISGHRTPQTSRDFFLV